METISITKDHSLYPEIQSIIIVFAAIATSMEYHISKVVNYNPGDYIAIEGLSSGKIIRLPLYGPIETAIVDKKPDTIDLTIEDISPKAKTYQIKTSALINTFNYVVSPYFVTFYEKFEEQATIKFGKDYDKWPDSWRMGWVIRNAISHNGKVHYKNLSVPSVTWRCITISPVNQDEQVLGNLLNIGDLLILLFDMESGLS